MSKTIGVMKQTKGVATSDGAGVKLNRMIGNNIIDMLDPFLMLDYFYSDKPDEYLAGFPNHPHRGFQTVTYMLNGKIMHKDSFGNEGTIKPNGIQWMNAGSGIIHSEMPVQENGLMQGFQLWINLPSSRKMSKPDYQEYEESEIPIEKLPNGGLIRVIAGKTLAGTNGVIKDKDIDPTYMDIELNYQEVLKQNLPKNYNGFIYTIEGEVKIGQNDKLEKNHLGILNQQEVLILTTDSKKCRFILVAGKPLKEPVVKGGPFVMNTKEELMQAFEDYQSGNFVSRES